MVKLQEKTRLQLVIFAVSQLEFAVPIEQVWRVEPLAGQKVTRVPRAPAFLDGVINVRGQIIPVLDLSKRLGFATGERPPKARILIVQLEGQRAGLIVDGVSDILWFPMAKIEPPPPMITQISGVFVQGVAKEGERLLIILDLREILNPQERQELEKIEDPV